MSESNQFRNLYCMLFACLLVFYVNSGFIKSFLKAANFIEFDVTIISLVCLMPLSIILIANTTFTRDRFVIVLLFVLFISTYCFSALYTSSNTYYISKLLAITGIVFSFIFGIVSPCICKRYFFRFFSFFTLIAVCLYFILIFSNLSVEALADFTGNSLVAGEMLGAAILFFYFSNISFKYSLIAISFAVLIALGARGPLLFSLLIISISLLNNLKKENLTKLIKFLSTFAIFLLIMISINNDFSDTFKKTFADGFSRFELLFQDNKGDSVNSRTVMLNKTFEHIENHVWFGTGIGSFGVEIYGQDFRAYPHNVPLEIWFESGLIPFIFFNLFLLAILYYVFLDKDFLMLSLLLYLFANMNKSSSLEELRFFFLVAGMSISSVKLNFYKQC